MARDSLEVFRYSNTEAVVAVLMQKIMRAARTKGPAAARLLLRDWLVILASNYHRIVHWNVGGLDKLLAVPVSRGGWNGGGFILFERLLLHLEPFQIHTVVAS